MGWFDSQIRERISNNKQQLQKAYWNLASVVMKETNETFADTQSTGNQNALTQICRYFHLQVNTVPDNIVDLEEQMEYLFRSSGIMRRRIKLAGEWWKDCYGPILAERKDGQMIALLQGKGDHYYYQDIKGKSKNRVDSQTAKELCEEAVCFYRPLPQRELTQKDLFKFILKSFTSQDKVYMIVTGLAIMLLGLIVPMATTFLLENILPSGQAIMVGSIAVLLAGTAVSKFLFSVVKEMMRGRVEQKMKVELQSAVFARILNLPVQFFKEYSAGELSERVMVLTELCTIFCEILLGFGMTSLFSLVYLIQILSIAPVMFLPALAVLFVQLLIAGVSVYGRLTVMTMELEASTKVQGIVYEIFSGIQKIKLVGCEERAFAKWAEKYQMEAENGKKLIGTSHVLSKDMPLKDAVWHTIMPQGDILPNVENLVNPAMLLESETFHRLLNEASEEYRYIFIDAPPLDLVSDGEKIGSLCDGAILVVASGKVSRGMVQNSIHQLERAGCPLLGIVLNRVEDQRKKNYYQKYGYYASEKGKKK